nr:CHAT domain-containing protein [Streptomyces sp. REN17]
MRRIHYEARLAAGRPEGVRQALPLALFAERLADSGCYDGDGLVMENMAGLLFGSYHKLTREPSAGVKELKIYLRLANSAPPDQRAWLDHNVAMAAFSLICQPNLWVHVATQGGELLRHLGLHHAELALSGYEVTPGFQEKHKHIARVHFLTADLLSTEPAREEYLKESLQHYTAAIKCIERFGVYWRLVSDIRDKQRRARTVLAGLHGNPAPPGAPIRHPERLLRGLPDEKAWEHLLARGMENEARGHHEDALRLYELAAVAISRRLALALDETTVGQIGDQCATGYHRLARSYARAGRHEDALNASETLRAATVRTARREIDLQNLADLVRRTGTYYPAVGGLTGIRDVMVDVLGQLHVMSPGSFAPGLGFLSLTVSNGTVLAFLVWREGDEWRTTGLDWGYGADLFDDLGDLHSKADSLTFRMRMFRRVLPRLFRTLVAPVMGPLADHHIEKLAISTGGLLSRIPFEALPIDGSRCLGEEFKVSYVPSIPLAAELPVRPAELNPRLLIVSYPDADLPSAAQCCPGGPSHRRNVVGQRACSQSRVRQ